MTEEKPEATEPKKEADEEMKDESSEPKEPEAPEFKTIRTEITLCIAQSLQEIN